MVRKKNQNDSAEFPHANLIRGMGEPGAAANGVSRGNRRPAREEEGARVISLSDANMEGERGIAMATKGIVAWEGTKTKILPLFGALDE